MGFGRWLSCLPSENSPTHWPLLPHSHCDGHRQSPINIKTKTVVVNEHLGDFTFTKFGDNHAFKKIINTGHTGE